MGKYIGNSGKNCVDFVFYSTSRVVPSVRLTLDSYWQLPRRSDSVFHVEHFRNVFSSQSKYSVRNINAITSHDLGRHPGKATSQITWFRMFPVNVITWAY